VLKPLVEPLLRGVRADDPQYAKALELLKLLDQVHDERRGAPSSCRSCWRMEKPN
jgi:hypothetical protein